MRLTQSCSARLLYSAGVEPRKRQWGVCGEMVCEDVANARCEKGVFSAAANAVATALIGNRESGLIALFLKLGQMRQEFVLLS